MRVLVLDEWLPWPPDSGKRLRSLELLQRLSGRHEITWLSPAGPEDAGAAEAMRSRGFLVETVSHPVPNRADPRFYVDALASLASPLPYVVARHRAAVLTRRIQELHGRAPFDLLHVEWTPLAANRPREWNRPWVVVAHNLESRIWERLSRVARAVHERAFFALESRRMAAYERQTFRAADAVIGVSADECAAIEALGGRAMCVENGVDLSRLTPAPGVPVEPVVLFTGALDWQANVDAVEYFLAQVWPRLRAAVPGARFQVVGRNPAQDWRRQICEHPGVEVHASVPDVKPYLERAAVVAVPLRVGGGTRLKILEALAMEKAVVSTPVGAEGLEITAGDDYVAADTPEAFADAVAALLAQPERRAALGRSGRRHIEGRYGWDVLAGKLELAWLAQSRAGAPT